MPSEERSKSLDPRMVDQRRVHRRHAGEDRDLLARDVLQHAVGVEADMHRHLGAGGDRQQQDEGEAEDVEQRQHHQRLVVAFSGLLLVQ